MATPSATPSAPRRTRLVVQFTAPEVAESSAADVAAALPGGHVVRVSRRGRVIISVERQGDVKSLLSELSARPDVAWAEEDTVDRAQ